MTSRLPRFVPLSAKRQCPTAVSYTHLTLPTKAVECRSRWWPDD
nr:hypothetical protein [Ralstonia sp. ASV6]